MKFLFIYSQADAPPPPAKPLHSWTQIHMGISYISSVLKAAGHLTRLAIPTRGHIEDVLDDHLREFAPDAICFTAIASEFKFIKEVAEYTREKAPGALLVIGGPHASLNPEEASLSFDVVCVGEGEYPMIELATRMAGKENISGIPNLWIRQSGSLEMNKTRNFMEDLDHLPFPDREMWLPLMEPDTTHVVLLGRGCPFDCAYCCNHALSALAEGKYVRFRTAENIISEIRNVCESFPDVTEIYFEVETITARQDWAAGFCNALREFNTSRDKPLRFGTNIRVTAGKSHKDLFEAFRRAGFGYAQIGIESGSDRVRREILRRSYSNEDIIRTCDEAREAGLMIIAYNMIGMPGETPDDFKETISINRRIAPDIVYLSVFYPYPGTGLYRTCIERGLRIETSRDVIERFSAAVELPEFPPRSVNHYFRWFDWYVYRGKKPLLKIILYAAWRTLAAHPRLFRAFRFITSGGTLLKIKQKLKYHPRH